MPSTIEQELAEIKRLAQQSNIRTKLLYTVEDVAFLTGFSEVTVYRWINEGRDVNGGKKTVFLKPASGLVDRGHRIFPDELEHFLSHFPPARV
ncbi:helix-turn-helix domain-containing protein [Larkinella arboricola]